MHLVYATNVFGDHMYFLQQCVKSAQAIKNPATKDILHLERIYVVQKVIAYLLIFKTLKRSGLTLSFTKLFILQSKKRNPLDTVPENFVNKENSYPFFEISYLVYKTKNRHA